MESVTLVESIADTPYGGLYIKEWLPNELSSNIPIIMLHDSLGCVKLWKDFPEMLATTLSRRIIAYDRLGFGQSDIRIEPPTADFIKEEASIFFPEIKKYLSMVSIFFLAIVLEAVCHLMLPLMIKTVPE